MNTELNKSLNEVIENTLIDLGVDPLQEYDLNEVFEDLDAE